jgi:hypothetical protein
MNELEKAMIIVAVATITFITWELIKKPTKLIKKPTIVDKQLIKKPTIVDKLCYLIKNNDPSRIGNFAYSKVYHYFDDEGNEYSFFLDTVSEKYKVYINHKPYPLKKSESLLIFLAQDSIKEKKDNLLRKIVETNFDNNK